MPKLFAPARRTRADDIFFPAMSLAILGVVIFGFARSYFLQGMVYAKLPNQLVHIHGAIFVSWIVLLIVQNSLIATKRIKSHMVLGVLGVILPPLMVTLGVLTLFDSIRRNNLGPPPVILLVGDLEQLVLFVVFIAWGLIARRQPDAHKRLMLLGTMSILAPAISRWPFPDELRLAGTIAVYLALPLILVIYDFFCFDRVHRTTTIGSITIAFAALTVEPFATTPFWQNVISWIRSS
jgi:hypothetical protein